MNVTDEMVNRFLCWKLPQDFAPDCHISFKLPDPILNPNPSWPVGTNLFSAEQARAMLEHVLGAPEQGSATEHTKFCAAWDGRPCSCGAGDIGGTFPTARNA
jgi:hypothetical protein